ncbi:MAG TPA: ABC transporter ATP-binding protein [Pyrinomonadaceae bacterium]|jgi:ABC-2 type transport system ATP-binding protein
MNRLDAETRGSANAHSQRDGDAETHPFDASASSDISKSEASETLETEAKDAYSRATSSRVAIRVEHLSKTYPVPLARLRQFFRRKSAKPVEALRNVSFEVREGEVFGLIGRNGAGKTTLTKIIATLVQPTEGVVNVRGHDSVREEERVRALIGLASAEERSFYWRLNAEQNLLFFARLYGLDDRTARRRIFELLSLVELEEVARRRFGELSTGNKQRMAVARALLNNPPVLLLDEPTRSLDPVAAARMRALIGRLAQGQPPTTILLTSHNLAEIEELCGRVAVISRGRIRAIDTPARLRARHRQKERAILTLGDIPHERAAQLLTQALGDDASVTSSEENGDALVSLVREPSDDLLDRAVRVLIEAGAKLLACDAERASLLDVLEIYESQEQEEAKAERGTREKGEKEKREARKEERV